VGHLCFFKDQQRHIHKSCTAGLINMRKLLIGLVITLLTSCSTQHDKRFEAIAFDETKLPNDLEKINDKTVVKWSNKLDTNYFEYFSYKQLGGQFKPIVIKVSGDDYSALRLLTFDNSEHLIGDYEIAGGQCGGPTELEDKIEFCPKKTSKMISPTSLLLKSVQEYYRDWNDSIPMQVDSTHWKIEINNKGQIIEVQ
jgi:hypothetical protein